MDTPKKILYRISELEIKLAGVVNMHERNEIKQELRELQRLRNKQKKQGHPTPKKPNFKRGL